MPYNASLVKTFKDNKAINRQPTNSHPTLISELQNAVQDKELALIAASVLLSSNWIEGNDLWIQDKNGTLIKTDPYPRKKLVTVQLGSAHFASEAAFSHPAVILYEELDWVLIAPITSKKFGKGLTLLVDIPKGACAGLVEPSTVQIDHIRAISKRRIIGTLTGTIPDPYMDKINDAILEKYTPVLFRKQKRILEENKKLKTEVEKLKQQLAEKIVK
ncbi:MAG: hypothetical protein JWM44_1985 [Bacilli bacterium]|nr:hypothetical protein [Bacilli bacterium]